MNIVSFGGGTNSTAMLIGMWEKGIPANLILFADTGAEMPHTYNYIEIMNKWLESHEMPQITIVKYVNRYGKRFTLEDECLKSKTLPAIAYGYKKCSLKHKRGVQDKFCNNCQACKETWNKGEKACKFIGFDAGEENRIFNARVADNADEKYTYSYPLYQWGWWRDDCTKKILEHHLPLPGKSSCFFCPSMKKPEIRQLAKQYPDLYARAVAIEDNAKENLLTVKGLGRNYAWKNMIEWEKSQIGMCEMYDSDDMPCDCYDG
jgi:hypothetical protein